jgi:hypothetical protein
MKPLLLLGCLLFASPAFSQAARYTNADLGQSVSSAKVTPAEAAAILAPHQFQLPPSLPPGPRVLGLWSSPTAGPFGEFPEFSPARRLDGTYLADPPWVSTTFLPFPYYGWGGGYARGHGGHGSHTPRPASRAR